MVEGPRPNQNSDGQRKKPSANPDGGARPGAAPMAPPMSPGQMQVQQIASQFQGAPGVPNTPGAGVPDMLQSFPQDAASLMMLMKQGYAPGADAMQLGMAQNAHSIARAQEQAALANADQVMEDEDDQMLLGGLLQKLMMKGKLPTPDEAAALAGGQQQQMPQMPPLQSSY